MVQLPSRARLVRAWLILMVLTLAGMVSGHAGANHAPALGMAGGAAVIAIAGLKARFVMMDYLNLRQAGMWPGLLTGYLVTVGGIILAAYAVGYLRA